MNDFYISETLFTVIWVIALFVLREFIKSKDGTLRKIMIAYFIVEFYTYFGASLYYFLLHKGWYGLTNDQYRVIIIIPKVIVKIWLLSWLISARVNKK